MVTVTFAASAVPALNSSSGSSKQQAQQRVQQRHLDRVMLHQQREKQREAAALQRMQQREAGARFSVARQPRRPSGAAPQAVNGPFEPSKAGTAEMDAIPEIEVEYEVLPHVITVDEAIADDAPVLHDHLFTQGVDPKPEKPSNIAKRVEFALGDVAAGFAQADLVVERTFNTAAVHQGYIEPHACTANFSEDGQAELWCCTQGHFVVRSYCARLLGMDVSKLRVTASEIGGGFGGKTVVYLEPLALALSRKANRPVKMVMSREDVLRATGPTSGAKVWVKMGVKNDGTITKKFYAADFAELYKTDEEVKEEEPSHPQP